MKEFLVVHLFLEGTFYRAYEISAWLCVKFISTFKPTHRGLKADDDSLIFVGFPNTSLQKYIIEGAVVREIGEKQLDLELPLGLFPEDSSIETIMTDFQHWKDSVPKPVRKQDRNKSSLEIAPTPQRLTDILRDVLLYPVENKTPIETIQFVLELKRKIIQII